MMLDRELTDAEPFSMSEYRCEAMQLSVDPDVSHHVLSIDLETTVEIMEGHARNGAHRGVEHSARHGLAERILPALLPSRYEIVTFVDHLQKVWNLTWIILQVGVHRKD